MRILVTGSRDWAEVDGGHQAIEAAVTTAVALGFSRNDGEDVVLVHGGARGADVMAGQVAERLGVKVEIHPADWTRFGKQAGFIRNDEMVKAGADICLAFIKDNSRGATMCADLAEKADITVMRFFG